MRRMRCSAELLLTVLLVSSFTFAGKAFAWQYEARYANGLWGSVDGKSWSPYAGTMLGDVGTDSAGYRATQPLALDVAWNEAAISWMNSHSGALSIAFHSSYDGNTGPTSCMNSWAARGWAASNLPGAWFKVKQRGCFGTWPNEVRVYADKSRLVADTLYWAQAWYRDGYGHAGRGQFNVDTYWDGNENYHHSYCVLENGWSATSC